MVADWLSVKEAMDKVGRTRRTLQLWAANGWIDRKYDADGKTLYGELSVLEVGKFRDAGRFVSRRPGPGRHRSFQSERLWDE